jgi:uncharacterized membrane protein YoaK (UPF0700 family)
MSDDRSIELPAIDVRLEKRLPVVLSAIAGAVDVFGFLNFKIFTAHVTGNLVLMAAQVVRPATLQVDDFVAVPVFIVAVACAWLISKLSARRGSALVVYYCYCTSYYSQPHW